MRKMIKTFFDDPEYLNPKEVKKIFKDYKEYLDLDKKVEGMRVEELSENIRIKANLFVPKNLRWELSRHGTGEHQLPMFIIYEDLVDEEDHFKDFRE